MKSGPVDPAAQLRLTFELFEVGVAMMEERLRRKFPAASPAELQVALERWLLKVDEPLSLPLDVG